MPLLGTLRARLPAVTVEVSLGNSRTVAERPKPAAVSGSRSCGDRRPSTVVGQRWSFNGRPSTDAGTVTDRARARTWAPTPCESIQIRYALRRQSPPGPIAEAEA